MEEKMIVTGEKAVHTLGDPGAENAVILLAGEEENGFLRSLYEETARRAGKPFQLCAVPVADWNAELTPWPAPGLRKGETFRDGAGKTLSYLENTLLPALGSRRFFLAGYSLAGLFALWACRVSPAFSGAAGVSPSLWYPGFADFSQAHLPLCPLVYLSLGEKEELSKHPMLKTVGDAVRAESARLAALPLVSMLEWNSGGHFQDPSGRLARAASWLMAQSEKTK